MKILILRLSALGDIIHSLPVAGYLKKCFPDSHLGWLVEPAGIELVENNPAIDEVIVFPKRKWLGQLTKISSWGNMTVDVISFIQFLHAKQYDLVIDLQGLFKSGLLSYLSAKVRIGFKGAREYATCFYTHSLDVGDYFAIDTHVVEHNLALAKFAKKIILEQDINTTSGTPNIIGYSNMSDIIIGGNKNNIHINDQANNLVSFPLPEPPLLVTEEIKKIINRDLVKIEDSKTKFIGIVPGTTWNSKTWGVSYWIELIQCLLKQESFRFFLIGTAAESKVNATIFNALQECGLSKYVIDLTGKTSLLSLIALYRELDLVIGVDTGPLHLAAATNIPQVIGIFGSTPHKRNGPYGSYGQTVSLDLSCQPCFAKNCPLHTNDCLIQLKPHMVIDRVRACLQ